MTHRLTAFLVVASIALASTSRAQDPQAGPDRFVQELAERGGFDLARKALDERAATSGFDARAPLLRAELCMREAALVGDRAARERLASEARAGLSAFVRSNPPPPLADEARLRLGEVDLQLGDLAARRASEPAADPAAREAARAEAVAAYERAVVSLRQCVEQRANALPAAGCAGNDEDLIFIISQAALVEARALHHHARVLAPGPERDTMFERAGRSLFHAARLIVRRELHTAALARIAMFRELVPRASGPTAIALHLVEADARERAGETTLASALREQALAAARRLTPKDLAALRALRPAP